MLPLTGRSLSRMDGQSYLAAYFCRCPCLGLKFELNALRPPARPYLEACRRSCVRSISRQFQIVSGLFYNCGNRLWLRHVNRVTASHFDDC